MADGVVVASRSKNPVLRVLGAGWPDETIVVAELRRLVALKGAGAVQRTETLRPPARQ
jgi:hypothetical protein